jgi:ATP/maltotriose-dependent transcriptional regulator MalT
MTADPDAVRQSTTETAGATPLRDEGTRAGRGRSAKLLPPTDPIGTLARPQLEARLLDGTERRLTIVVGGAGFGKSTLAARVAAARPTAWYTLDASDRHIGALASGITAALRVRLPAIADAPRTLRSIRRPTMRRCRPGSAAAALIVDALRPR